MQVTFSYLAGPRVVADVLGIGVDYVRLAEPGRADSLCLYLTDEKWVTETGREVRVEYIGLGLEPSRWQRSARAKVH